MLLSTCWPPFPIHTFYHQTSWMRVHHSGSMAVDSPTIFPLQRMYIYGYILPSHGDVSSSHPLRIVTASNPSAHFDDLGEAYCPCPCASIVADTYLSCWACRNFQILLRCQRNVRQYSDRHLEWESKACVRDLYHLLSTTVSASRLVAQP